MYYAALYTDAAEGEVTVVTSESEGMLGSPATMLIIHRICYLLIILNTRIRSCIKNK